MREAVFDGEIVAFDEAGRPSFGRLQHRMHVTSPAAVRRLAASTPVVYAIFDLLYLDGHSLMSLPYHERRARLEALGLGGPAWRVPTAHPGDGARLLEATRAQGLEGIVAKRLDSSYEPGRRTGAWVKVKHTLRQELVIGGWIPGEGRRAERIGALLMGYNEDGAFRYAGRVGTGFTEKTLDDLASRLASAATGHEPVRAGPEAAARGGVRRAVPRRRDRVHRMDRRSGDARPVVQGPARRQGLGRRGSRELANGETQVATSTRRGTPEELFDEVRAAARRLARDRDRRAPAEALQLGQGAVPADGLHEGRPDQLLRADRGGGAAASPRPAADAQALSERRRLASTSTRSSRPSHRPEWVQTAKIGDVNYTLAQDRPTLIWLANLADIELHTSLSLASRPERPTMLVFDLDPGPPAGLVECCEVALVLHGLFDQLGLESVVKTSGSKGLQVYVPLNVPLDYGQTKPFARRVAELLEQRMPELVVSRMTKRLRPGKVLVDWSQNDAHKTTVTVYSVRARERPTVSTPVGWDEVTRCRTAGDPAAADVRDRGGARPCPGAGGSVRAARERQAEAAAARVSGSQIG